MSWQLYSNFNPVSPIIYENPQKRRPARMHSGIHIVLVYFNIACFETTPKWLVSRDDAGIVDYDSVDPFILVIVIFVLIFIPVFFHPSYPIYHNTIWIYIYKIIIQIYLCFNLPIPVSSDHHEKSFSTVLNWNLIFRSLSWGFYFFLGINHGSNALPSELDDGKCAGKNSTLDEKQRVPLDVHTNQSIDNNFPTEKSQYHPIFFHYHPNIIPI